MAFYKCSKCNRVWQQPVKVCPYCFVELEKLKGKTAKVIGVSKVSIPTIFHPQVPYFLLILEDEFSNKWVYKSEKEMSIGEDFVIEPDENKDAVSIWRIKYDMAEAIEEALNLLGGFVLKTGSKVLVMPMIVSPNHAYFRENTSPDFLGGVIEFLLDKGVKKENIKIGTQSFEAVAVEASAQKSGLIDVCLKNNMMPIDLAKSNFIKRGGLEISEEVINADLVLNLSMMKIGRASSADNIFKILKKDNYEAVKYLKSEKEIIDEISGSVSNILTIGEADSVRRSNGIISYLGIILAGKSPLNVDAVFNRITHAARMPEILSSIAIDNIPVVGRTIKEVEYDVD
jgi:uncharacterized protein (DUF362 family)